MDAKMMKPPAMRIVAPSWHGFVARAQRPPAKGVLQRFSHEEGSQHAKLFRGTDTFDEAVELARHGWVSGAERAQELADEIAAKVQRVIVKAEPQYATEGVSVDIERFLGGETEHWHTWHGGQRLERDIDQFADPFRQRQVRIVVNLSPSAEVTPEAIDVRGIGVLALVKVLEYAGHRVEVDGVVASEGDAGRVELWVPIKRLSEPLNAPRLAFALAHRAMVRRLCFAILESSKLPDDRVNRGYGKPASIIESDQGDLYLDYLRGNNLEQVEATQGWLLLQLKAQGIPLRATEGVA